jgi:hypothetical protein
MFLSNVKNSLMFGKIPISVVQSLIIIATSFVYYCGKNPFLIVPFLSVISLTFGIAFIAKKLNLKFSFWQIASITSIVSIILFHDVSVQAQILEGIDDATGGGFADDVLQAIVQIIRIAIYIVIAGVVIAAIFMGVAQNQWQAPVLVVGVIVGIGLFLEVMGQVVFG